MKIIIWLGNPGKQYENTRHNVGYIMVDELRDVWDFPLWSESRFQWVVSEGTVHGEKILLLKPTTYMNLSWESVAKVMNFYKLNPKTDILVLVDDLDMDFAKVRYRKEWSAGGQNGLKSLIEHFATPEFHRIKIGIGRDARYEVSDWVLSKFQKWELEVLKDETFLTVREKIEEWIQDKK